MYFSTMVLKCFFLRKMACFRLAEKTQMCQRLFEFLPFIFLLCYYLWDKLKRFVLIGEHLWSPRNNGKSLPTFFRGWVNILNVYFSTQKKPILVPWRKKLGWDLKRVSTKIYNFSSGGGWVGYKRVKCILVHIHSIY